MRILINLVVMVLPWFFKKRILRTFYKYKINDTAYIGLSYVYPKYLEMGEGASIGHFNVAIHLNKMTLGRNSSIGRSNWITGFPTGTNSKHFAHQKNRKSELIIGDESAITKKHHIDCTNSITIGKFTTIAGYNSQFLTHSIDIYEGRQDSHPIEIGDYCFVSTSVIILGGSKLPCNSVLAAGTVLNKKYEDEYKLYAGVPAIPRKNITNDAKYFYRETGFIY